jgi:coenzyme F420 biosynthesis associated uncharacterized protein
MTISSAAGKLRTSRAVRLGVAIGLGMTARALSARLGRVTPEGLVDWPRAEELARRRASRAPGRLTTAQLQASEPAYARHMARVVPLLEQRLEAALPGVVDRHAVVSRADWASANMATFKALVAHLEPHLLPRTADGRVRQGFAATANRLLTTGQVGFLLGYLGSRVLGQYDIALLSAEQEPGRLLYVEENIRTTARALEVPLEDFRLWVALHETTHAFELETHPWLRPYMRDRLERQIALFVEETGRLQRGGLGQFARRWRTAAAERSLRGFMSPEQRGLLKETQLVMSLMEGFSDWVMDEVGAEVLPDVAAVRRRFEAKRRQRRRGIDRVMARLTGMDLKMEQYRRGERFVSGVYQAGGDAAIAHLWDGPETLPTDGEMDDPSAWVRRVTPAQLESGGTHD